MSSNFISTDIVNNKHLHHEMNIYKDTIKNTLKTQKNIQQLKNINNHDSQNNINDDKKQNSLENPDNLHEDSIVLLDMMKKAIKKMILKKYNINIEQTNTTKKYDNINQDDLEEDVNEIYQQIMNNKNQNVFMKKKLLTNPKNIISIHV